MTCKEAIAAADELLEMLGKKGHNYSAHRAAIIEAFDEGLLEGNWDVTATCPGMKDIRLIQEDEYDQHMDDDKPEWDDMVGYVGTVPAYAWLC